MSNSIQIGTPVTWQPRFSWVKFTGIVQAIAGSFATVRFDGNRYGPAWDQAVPAEDCSTVVEPPVTHHWNSESCSCGADTCLCQKCAKPFCGSLGTWVKGVGNVCHCCLPAVDRPAIAAEGSAK